MHRKWNCWLGCSYSDQFVNSFRFSTRTTNILVKLFFRGVTSFDESFQTVSKKQKKNSKRKNKKKKKKLFSNLDSYKSRQSEGWN